MLDRRFAFDGNAIAWAVGGEGPPVVLVHGTPFSAHVWHRIAPHLERHARVFRFDLLGYGGSAKGAGIDVSLAVQNRLLAALLDHWGLALPHVVAHDFGGATALRAWVLDGRRYASLTLIDPVALAPWGSPFVRHVRDHEAAFAGLPPAMHQALLQAYVRSAVSRHLLDAELEPYLAPWLGPAGQAAFYAQIAAMDQRYTDVLEPGFGTIDCATSILWGEADAWLPIAQGQRLAGLIPGARFVPVSGAGHLVQEDAPEAIVAAVLPALLAAR